MTAVLVKLETKAVNVDKAGEDDIYYYETYPE